LNAAVAGPRTTFVELGVHPKIFVSIELSPEVVADLTGLIFKSDVGSVSILLLHAPA